MGKVAQIVQTEKDPREKSYSLNTDGDRDGLGNKEIPWGFRDVLSAIALSLAVFALFWGSTQLVEAILNREQYLTLLGKSTTVVFLIGLVLVITVINRIKIGPVLIAVFITSLFAVIIGVSGDTRIPNVTDEIGGIPVGIVVLAILNCILIVVTLLYVKFKYQSNLKTLGFISPFKFTQYPGALIYWVFGLVLVFIWSFIIKFINLEILMPPENAKYILNLASGNMIITMGLVGLWGPVAEEVFFRGFMISGLKAQFGWKSSVIISSLIFSVFHIEPGAIIPTFLLGAILGYIFIRYGSIWPSIFIHALHNMIAVLMASVDVNL